MILLQKLTKLVLNTSGSNICRIFQTLASKGDILNISLIQQCRELEILFSTKFIEQCLAATENAVHIVHEAKSCLVEADWKRTITMASLHPSLTHICSSMLVNEWMLLSDQALDYGPIGTVISQTIFKILSKPMFGDNICCYSSENIPELSFVDHLASSHGLDLSSLLSSISDNKTTLFKPRLSKCVLKFLTVYLHAWILLRCGDPAIPPSYAYPTAAIFYYMSCANERGVSTCVRARL